MLTFITWNVVTTWWVGESTIVARIGIPIGSLFFTLLPFMIFHWFRKRAPKAISWAIFVTIWIAFEKLFMENEISFPWLTLGYGFMKQPWLVQWYEWTGSFGGSLWVLVGNILIYEAWQCRKDRGWKAFIPSAAWVVLPMLLSVAMYVTYTEEDRPVKVAVVQPNIEPYTEKFDGLTQEEQREILLELAAEAPRDVQYILTPETALEDGFILNNLDANPTIDSLKRFMNRFPRAELILGATTFRVLDPGDPHERWTRVPKRGASYNAYNSAIGIEHQGDWEVYHKSKLVIGTEMFPYPKVMGLFKFLNLDLGGISGNLGMQPERTVFTSPDGVKTGVAICYESVYGAFFTEYVQAGAQFMSIITNDGWWGDTQGYRHHFHFARLRAIETRRSIARSANTGISGFINQRGDILQQLGWDEQGMLVDEINLNDRLTFYVRYGDYIFRISLLILGLSVFYYVAWRYKRKGLLVEE